MKIIAALAGICCLSWSLVVHADVIQPANVTFPDDSIDPLATLKPTHPRLIISAEEVDALVKNSDDPLRGEVNKRILATAEATLTSPPIAYKLSDRGTLLLPCRAAFQRIVLCSMAYRMTHDVRFANRAKAEMLEAATLPDWHPAEFLDVAEMATGVAIGYDWCYDALSPDDRKTIKQALVDKALVYAQTLYGKHVTDPSQLDPKFRWVLCTYNWNQVCHGGLLAAALAVADEEPAKARQVVQGVRAYMPLAMHSYGPDGAWFEGPVYLAYATDYSVLALSMLQSALGTDFGLGKVEPAFSKAAQFHLDMSSPYGALYNYGDGYWDEEIRSGVSPAFGWMANQYGPPAEAAQIRDSLRQHFATHAADKETNQYFAFNFLWLPPPPKDSGAGALDAHYRGEADVAVFRGAWGDADALYLGFKNGKNGINHSHLDLGSFVLDSDKVRWAMLLGPDNYVLPNYNHTEPNALRWTYFRANNYSASTLIPDHQLQDTQAVAPIYSFSSTPDLATAVSDLTSVYPGTAKKIIRGVSMLKRVRILVQDDLTGLTPNTPVNWQMITRAQIDIAANGHTATLTSEGKTLRVDLLSPPEAKFTIGSAAPPTPAEKQNEGFSILTGTVPASATATDVRVAVLLTPVGPKWPAGLPAPPLQALPSPGQDHLTALP